MTRNRVIGRGGQLPWRLSADLRRFKALTMGHHIVMGRRTYESIGRPLPGRTTIVLTRQSKPERASAEIQAAPSLDEALERARNDDEVFIIGGAEIYALALPRSDRLYVTWVDADIGGDTFFPEFDWQQWRLVSEESHPADAKNQFPSRFVVYDRIQPPSGGHQKASRRDILPTQPM